MVNAAGDVINVISQSSIIHYLHKHQADVGPIGSHTVEKMACGSSPVHTVKTTDSILSAFEIMAKHNIMGCVHMSSVSNCFSVQNSPMY